MRESDLLRTLLLAAPSFGARLLRNNVGTLQDIRGNYVKYGLGVGSSDLIGWTETLITQDMVGRTVAIFTAIEAKMPGKKPTEAQRKFIAAVLRAGGIATVAYSSKDVQHAIEAHWDNNRLHHTRANRRTLHLDSEPPGFSLDK